MESKGKRNIKQGDEFTHLFPQADGRDTLRKRVADVSDTVELMQVVIANTLHQTKRLAQEVIKGNSVQDTTRKLWQFVYDHIQYERDAQGIEQIREPARTWRDRHKGVDCDCMSVFHASVLHNLEIPYTLRITDYGKGWQHVYVVVPIKPDFYTNRTNKSNYITIDTVKDEYNQEQPFYKFKDYDIMQLHQLSGIDDFETFEGLEDLEDVYEIDGLGRTRRKKRKRGSKTTISEAVATKPATATTAMPAAKTATATAVMPAVTTTKMPVATKLPAATTTALPSKFFTMKGSTKRNWKVISRGKTKDGKTFIKIIEIGRNDVIYPAIPPNRLVMLVRQPVFVNGELKAWSAAKWIGYYGEHRPSQFTHQQGVSLPMLKQSTSNGSLRGFDGLEGNVVDSVFEINGFGASLGSGEKYGLYIPYNALFQAWVERRKYLNGLDDIGQLAGIIGFEGLGDLADLADEFAEMNGLGSLENLQDDIEGLDLGTYSSLEEFIENPNSSILGLDEVGVIDGLGRTRGRGRRRGRRGRAAEPAAAPAAAPAPTATPAASTSTGKKAGLYVPANVLHQLLMLRREYVQQAQARGNMVSSGDIAGLGEIGYLGFLKKFTRKVTDLVHKVASNPIAKFAAGFIPGVAPAMNIAEKASAALIAVRKPDGSPAPAPLPVATQAQQANPVNTWRGEAITAYSKELGNAPAAEQGGIIGWVKKNPLPSALIAVGGAGVAYYAFAGDKKSGKKKGKSLDGMSKSKKKSKKRKISAQNLY